MCTRGPSAKDLAVTTLPIAPLSPATSQLPTVGERLQDGDVHIEVYAVAHLPTRFGDFELLVFRNNLDDKEHLALVHGPLRDSAQVITRLHSECLTGDVLGSLRCDCRDQLEMGLGALRQAPAGILLYMRQEGRGIGLGNKVRAYALQEQGLDTVEANHHLGFDDDVRDYRIAAMILRMLGPASIQLATNNPRKLFALKAHGIDVAGRLPLVVRENVHNAHYLATKARKAGHMLPIG
jgi:GTP cyclohydrolase II